ncbi:PREDICTED: inositol 1,4,5-trisphosphate receptor-interacting protein-like 1, partial [Pterocles gutturalis]|uniref:inositol 1,4,5-trisphosphate receptor-interacting protein-like 1 n=1 Tax=Pterocles gutturalis TaxID=240206 RepID=UPI000528FDEC
FWALAGVLVLLFWLGWWLRKRSHQPASSNEENDEQEEREGEDADDERGLIRIVTERIRWPEQNLVHRSKVDELVGDLLCTFKQLFSNTFLPVLQPAIKLGSTFEGWSPQEDDAVYCLLVPLEAPRGHTFHLELGPEGEMPARNSRIRVEVECCCRRQWQAEYTLCFLHQPAIRRIHTPSLLHTLCTDSYLDVMKTVHFFRRFVDFFCSVMPQSHHCRIEVLPFSRSFKLQLTTASGRPLFVEIIFGVRQGNSDIFLSSQSTEDDSTPSTTWTESYAVAEAKFFSIIARQAPQDSFHLKCLQLFARIELGRVLSTDILKTVVMHLLTIIPMSGWRRRDFLKRLADILQYLHYCIKEKSLNHFFFGNENVPEEIILLPSFRRAEPYNLLYHLVDNPAAQNEVLHDFSLVLPPAVGVGSTFEGWSPREEDAVYHLLVPLHPLLGHAFRLDLGTVEEMLARDSCLCMVLQCTCMGERLVENMLCFLHHSEDAV